MGLALSETMHDDKVVIASKKASSNEGIAEKKTIVYETRVDPIVIKLAGEKLKKQLFTRLGFLKPRSDEVQFVSIEKYYEPYSLINGRYISITIASANTRLTLTEKS